MFVPTKSMGRLPSRSSSSNLAATGPKSMGLPSTGGLGPKTSGSNLIAAHSRGGSASQLLPPPPKDWREGGGAGWGEGRDPPPPLGGTKNLAFRVLGLGAALLTVMALVISSDKTALFSRSRDLEVAALLRSSPGLRQPATGFPATGAGFGRGPGREMMAETQQPLSQPLSQPQIQPQIQPQFQPESDGERRYRTRWSRGRRIAVCMVGGARDFELSGPTILTTLLQASYPGHHKDVFQVSPLDESSFKFWIMKDTKNIAAVKIFPPDWIDQNENAPPKLLRDDSSPMGLQGIFQYFRLVESCVPLIEQHQSKHGFTYEWVMRLRVDEFWHKPAPPLAKMKPDTLMVPLGSTFDGMNDRLEMATWPVAKRLLRWLTNMHSLADLPKKGLNSNRAVHYEAIMANVSVVPISWPFCTVTRRIYTNDNVPIFSLDSTAEQNGAKCRPCRPKWTGEAAREHYKTYNPIAAVTKEWPEGLDLCDATTAWEEGWEGVYDRQMGPVLAHRRQTTMAVTFEECVEAFEEIQAMADVWAGESPAAICFHRILGTPSFMGDQTQAFYAYPRALRKDDVVGFAHELVFNTTRQTWKQALEAKIDGIQFLKLNSPEEAKGRQRLAAIMLSSTQLEGYKQLLEHQDWGPCQVLVHLPVGAYASEKLAAVGLLKARQFDLGPCIRERIDLPERCVFYSVSMCAKHLKTNVAAS